MMRVERALAVVALLWFVGVAGGWQSLSSVVADETARTKNPGPPAFQAVKTPGEAVARIKQLGGRVRYLSAKRKVLVVDLRFAVEGLSDDHLQYITLLKDVGAVLLKRVAVTDAGLVHLARVSTLEELDLSETAITDAGLKTIARLPALKTLNLYGTSVTDAGLAHLKSVKTLRRLFVAQTRASADGVAALKAANAELAVVPDRSETRRRIGILVDAARTLLTAAEKALKASEKEHNELTPQLGKFGEAEKTTKAESDKTSKAQVEAKKAADAAKKVADDLASKLKAAREKYVAALKSAGEARVKATAAKKKSDEAKQRHERAKKAKPGFDLATRIRDASRLRLADARRRQIKAPGVPFEPKQDKLPAPVPPGATVLFDGSDTTKFLSKTGKPINWPIQDGQLVSSKGGQNSNHIVSSVHFRDAVIHVEFLLPPKGSGNSGVYIHGNYELQIIRSHGKKNVTQKDMGAVYGFAKPLVNAARKPGQWQVYDILYEAPRRDDKQKIVKQGSITAWLNGQLVQQETRVGEPRSVYHPYRHETTPYLKAIFEKQKKTMTGPVFLQDHGHAVRFRNVWILPLDDHSHRYQPKPTAGLPAAKTVDVGTARQLLVDDLVIDKLAGLTRVVQQPQRVSDKPVLTAEHPWEGRVVQMPGVVWDPRQRVFHMYYWAAVGDAIYTCYARSTDGLRWEKPRLNLHAGPDGSKQNNIVLRGEGKQARTRYVVLNPRKDDPQRRFLALYIDNVPGLTEFAASSPDGLHWRTEKKIGDLRQIGEGKPSANPPFFLVEQQWVKDPVDGHRYRAIWRTESRDLKNWTGGKLVIERLPDDDPHVEFYHACSHMLGSQTYCGLHLGYLYLFHTESNRGVRKDGVRLAGTVDTALIASRDTIRWTRVDRRRRFFPLGRNGSWEGRMNYVAPEVVVGDRMLFYYSGWKKEHAAGDNEAAIGLATLPRDRFVAVEPKKQRGQLTTRPFVVKGGKLLVNVDAEGGGLKVEVLSGAGKPIPGYDSASCEPVTSDGLDVPIKWKDHALEKLRGQAIRLRFSLDHARLFAFQLR